MWNRRAADRTGTAAVAAPPIDLLVRTAGPAGVELGQPSTSRRSRPIRSAVASHSPSGVGRRRLLPFNCHAPATAPGAPRSEEHTSELQSLMRTLYAVFCLT